MRRATDDGQEFRKMLRGWCLGSEEFRNELLAQRSEEAGAEDYGQEICESAEQKGLRLIHGQLKAIARDEGIWFRPEKGAPEKLRIALRLRKETTMTLEWIAKHLHTGTKTHLHYWNGREKS